MPEAVDAFLDQLKRAIHTETFVKLTLSKPVQKKDDLRNVYVKPVVIKAGNRLSFVYKYTTRQEVKNFESSQAWQMVSGFLSNRFLVANLFTIDRDFNLLMSAKGHGKLVEREVEKRPAPDTSHDKIKNRLLDETQAWWFKLGISSRDGQVLPSMQHKFKQINKYVEILDGLMQKARLGQSLKVVDMGAGKGYLTFALYEYLMNQPGMQLQLTGVEMRPDLVTKTNQIASSSGMQGLHFEQGTIEAFPMEEVDVLIALHACDTATDDAIAAGIKANASLIVCAPCCHKQIRNAMSASPAEIPMLQYGILFERQAEMLTDTIRALIMEYHGYKSQIMEFIEADHTPKNILLTGTKSQAKIDQTAIRNQIVSLKTQYKIQEHYLETALGINF